MLAVSGVVPVCESVLSVAGVVPMCQYASCCGVVNHLYSVICKRTDIGKEECLVNNFVIQVYTKIRCSWIIALH